MLEAGFDPDFAPDVLAQAAAPVAASPPEQRDLRDLLWSSIDNPTSRDLDQIEFVKREGNDEMRISIGIADVDAFVPKGSPADQRAAQNGFSIYLGVATFPMLPPQLSNDRSSLVPDHDRPAVVFEIVLHADDTIDAALVSSADVRNHAKLDYESVGAWMEQTGNAPPIVIATAGLAEQLQLQREATERLHTERLRAGALEFESIEPQPVMTGQNIATLELQRKNRARDLIEDLMIAANRSIAKFLEEKGWSSLQRIVRTPERWPRIVELAALHGGRLPDTADAVELAKFLKSQRQKYPARFPDLSLAIIKLIGPAEYVVVRDANDNEGHFGLAVHDYTHSTAPNRRYPDLVVQRLLKAAVGNQPSPYSVEDLEQIAARSNERAAAARKIERLMRKVAAATFLGNRVGQTFEGIVTGASIKGTYVRISNPPAEGRVVRGEAGLDVGDKVRVKLIGTVPEKGFIDFARNG
ncbi:MAG: RNB domain-containing ribonuclease [Chthoniobacterales bacterium]